MFGEYENLYMVGDKKEKKKKSWSHKKGTEKMCDDGDPRPNTIWKGNM